MTEVPRQYLSWTWWSPRREHCSRSRRGRFDPRPHWDGAVVGGVGVRPLLEVGGGGGAGGAEESATFAPWGDLLLGGFV